MDLDACASMTAPYRLPRKLGGRIHAGEHLYRGSELTDVGAVGAARTSCVVSCFDRMQRFGRWALVLWQFYRTLAASDALVFVHKTTTSEWSASVAGASLH